MGRLVRIANRLNVQSGHCKLKEIRRAVLLGTRAIEKMAWRSRKQGGDFLLVVYIHFLIHPQLLTNFLGKVSALGCAWPETTA